MSVAIVAFYAGLNGLLALVLAINVVRLRAQTRTDLGHGGHRVLEQAQRAHGNLIEYVPIILLLLLLLAMTGLAAAWLHALGIALTAARLLHAWGLLGSPGASAGRLAGATLTFLTMLAAAILAIIQGAAAL
jgi:uncharacterized membrane protein YecN with MAPEG domain